MKAFLFVAVIALVLVVVAYSAPAGHQILYTRKFAPDGWENAGRAEQDERRKFYIALKQRNIDVLEKVLYQVSHPRSPLYGEHWSHSKIMDLIAPPQEHHDLVLDWLFDAGVKPQDVFSLRDSLLVETTVEIIEKIFHTEMYVFVNSRTGRRIVAHMGDSSIPNRISEYVDMVSALSLFPPTRRSRAFDWEPSQDENGTAWAIPPHLREVYNIPASLRSTNKSNSVAAVEFEWPGCFSYTDMQQYSQVIEMPFTNVSRIIPVSEWVDQGCDAESTMDLQLMSNIASGAQVVYFTNEFWIYEMTQTIMSTPNPPLVYSLSWGWMEADTCQSITNAECSQLGVDAAGYVSRTNIELAKLGSMGLSVVICTQDEGAPSDNNDDCSLDDTSQPVWPIYPASSPFVTAVGATTLVANSGKYSVDDPSLTPICQQYTCNNGTEEVVAMSSDMDTLFTSGGGFSNFTARPSYQTAAVQAYFNSGAYKPPYDLFGYQNRGYPDISAAGSHMGILLGGVIQWNGGTSASTPIFAGVVAMLNDHRLNQGKKPLGFLNHLLYEMGASYPKAFHDVTVGNNTCTGWAEGPSSVYCCKYGYAASKGWDPATGWGTPNFSNIVAYLDSLDD